MNVVITGAAGFVGSHLVDRYLRDGHHVIGVDNMLTGASANLDAALGDGKFQHLRLDVSEPSWIEHPDVRGTDLLLHFASPASPVDYTRYPIETMLVNSRGTELCCRLAAKHGARLLFASTSEAYGEPLEHPQSESYWGNVNPVGVRSCYDESKRFAEAMVSSFARWHDLDARIIRIFNTYGPRMRLDDGRVVPNFICQALAGQPMTLFGRGQQTRSLCYVDDLVEGVVRCAASDRTRGLVVNLGNPNEQTIVELAQAICRVVGSEPRFQYRPLPEDDPTRRCPDISRARQLLGFEPAVSLETGLRMTVADFKGRLSGES
ncbi:MAG: NAD-dependent dehydratase [Candidatus Eremiobacter antarcticus]|nr:SDR family oxidoreductase [Candidatus Eremiobacteraeota bacterium]PZR60829.1 MAG: NAD-dependent dehydratase [Candidatus Eremiobacter sp. RRmetagenome_bin22]